MSMFSEAMIRAQGGQRGSESAVRSLMARRASIRWAVTLAFTICAVPLLGAASADARSRTTAYYTINVAAPTPASSGLFLGTQDGVSRRAVTLRRYRSGDQTIQWTPVYPEWPASPRITGTSPLDGLASCIGLVPNKCKFTGAAGRPPLKFVNRASGMCLTLGPPHRKGTTVVQSRCADPGNGLAVQTWELREDPRGTLIPTGLTQVSRGVGKRALCLDVTGFRNVINTRLQGWACQPIKPKSWNQRFRFLPVAEASCEVGITNFICGIGKGKSKT
jgi:hypothetical protein